MISASIVLDSVTQYEHRLTTIEFSAPRFILAQFNTHRVFSRNAGSSRAIPVNKIIEKVIHTPVIPIWNKNKPGMQGEATFTAEEIAKLTEEWLAARDSAVLHAKRLNELGAHKQIVNRLLEPFMFFKGVVSSTEWDNFLKLREHDAAQPEIAILATAIRGALDSSQPTLLEDGQWHLPYVQSKELNLDLETQIKISVARCARVSYKTFDDDKVSTVEKDTALFKQLFDEKHLSPFEHQAKPLTTLDFIAQGMKSGNFVGWNQYRKQIEKEVQ